jgi:hypothetical protein
MNGRRSPFSIRVSISRMAAMTCWLTVRGGLQAEKAAINSTQ